MARVSIEPFEAHHLAGLELQTAQGPELSALGLRALDVAIAMGPAFTAFRGAGVIGCAGLAINAPHHATAWALFGEHIGCRDWTVLVASIRGVIEAAGFERIDMMVRDGFERAHRFARHLGFEQEGVLRRYGAGGIDFAIYARVMDGERAPAGLPPEARQEGAR